SFETKFEGGNPTPMTRHEKNGYLLLNEDKTKAIQLRKNGFMYSITQQSYISWDEFKKDAWGYFNDIIELYNINEVSKLSLRYINSINLPTKIPDIKEYILIAPDIPEELNYGINRMFLQMVLPNTNNESVGIVTQNFNIGRELNETFSYIIDIDVSIAKNRNIKDIDGIKSDFDKLRDFKNEIFFKSITDKTIELFKK
ncbi:MAG: TIGR04255 family protein, partial [Flavobacteriales bacterium]|nr:TIGR04255 family protein [Flavobacteriales bacterium]